MHIVSVQFEVFFHVRIVEYKLHGDAVSGARGDFDIVRQTGEIRQIICIENLLRNALIQLSLTDCADVICVTAAVFVDCDRGTSGIEIAVISGENFCGICRQNVAPLLTCKTRIIVESDVVCTLSDRVIFRNMTANQFAINCRKLRGNAVVVAVLDAAAGSKDHRAAMLREIVQMLYSLLVNNI